MRITNLIRYSYAMLIALFAIAGCDTKDDPVSSSGVSYAYKGMLVGSTGHVEAKITSKSSTGDGTGSVTITIDGVTYTLTPADDKTAGFKDGDSLHQAKFSDGKGTTLTISLDKDGKVISVTVSIAGHEGGVGVVMLKEGDGDEKVEVYEGVQASYTSENLVEANLVEKTTFNIVIKGNKAEIMRKTSTKTANSCLSDEEFASTQTAMPQSLESTVKIEGDKYTFTISEPIPDKAGGGTHKTSIVLTKSGNSLQSEVMKEEGRCVAQGMMLDPERAYDVDNRGQPAKGYNLQDGGTVLCSPRHDETAGSCPAVPTGKTPLDTNGNSIAPGSSYYVVSTDYQDVFSTLSASKTL